MDNSCFWWFLLIGLVFTLSGVHIFYAVFDTSLAEAASTFWSFLCGVLFAYLMVNYCWGKEGETDGAR